MTSNPLDLTNNKADWERLPQRTPLWKHKTVERVFSTDGGQTYTIEDERVSQEIPRPVHVSRKV